MDYNYLIETKTLQVNDNYFIEYYYSNTCEERTTFTIYKGDMCSPEYSKEIIHIQNGNKRYKEKEILEYGRTVINDLLPRLKGEE